MPLDAFSPERVGAVTFESNDSASLHRLHRSLSRLNHARMTPTCDTAQWPATLDEELRLRRLEYSFVESLRAEVSERAQHAPNEADAFVAWFEALQHTGPGQGDELFPWLAEQASLAQMKWFLSQELAGEAGFDDLVSLTQVKLNTRPKLELARNYWDEMGQGTASGMHGPMLETLAQALELSIVADDTVWEASALANLMCALASNRHYAYQSIGALGVIELTAPARSACVNAGLKRLEVAGNVRRYYALHATLDVKHSAAWNREVLRPIVAHDPSTARAIAEGALMRLLVGERCFVRYRRELGVPLSAAAAHR
jgi:Iron-containing redox enzyme